MLVDVLEDAELTSCPKREFVLILEIFVRVESLLYCFLVKRLDNRRHDVVSLKTGLYVWSVKMLQVFVTPVKFVKRMSLDAFCVVQLLTHRLSYSHTFDSSRSVWRFLITIR